MKARVKRVKWDIDKRGFIQPIVLLTKPIEIEGNKFDSLVVAREDVIELGLGPNAEFTLKSVDGLMLDIDSVIRTTKVALPSGCPVCNFNIADGKCTNNLCSGKGRTPIFKLFKFQFPLSWNYSSTFERLNNYLDNFPISFETTVVVEDYIDFLTYFTSSGKKNTNARFSMLREKLGKTNLVPCGEDLIRKNEDYTGLDLETLSTFEIELERRLVINVDENLQRTLSMPVHVFWDSLSLLNFRQEDYETIRHLDPLDLNLLQSATACGVSKKGIDQLKTLDPLLARVLSFFNKEQSNNSLSVRH